MMRCMRGKLLGCHLCFFRNMVKTESSNLGENKILIKYQLFTWEDNCIALTFLRNIKIILFLLLKIIIILLELINCNINLN